MNQTLLFTEILKAKQKEQPFVLFRYPETNTIKGYIQEDNSIDETPIDELTGFVFAPFNNKKRVVAFAENKCKKLDADAETPQAPILKTHAFKQEDIDSKYQELIKKGISFLDESTNEKVVLSRRIIQPVDQPDFIQVFKELLTFENAFIYCWYHPKIGMWIGASPETLVSIDDKQFSTMSLAGTKEFKGESTANWTNKEKHEQKLVTDYLVEKLKEYDIDVSEAYTVKAGNVVHLRSDVKGSLKEESEKAALVNLIHPTPAICGVPTCEAKKFILENEGYDRAFYTGYLGEVSVDNHTQLHVNLRCMELTSNHAIIYVGGGITRQSDPLSEWEETCVKSQLMLNLLANLGNE